ALVEVISAGGGAAGASSGIVSGAFPASTKQNQVIGDDFGFVFLLASFFVVPGTGAQAAFDVALAAFLEILSDDLGQALKRRDVVPLGAILPLALFVLEAVVGGQCELGDRHVALGVF